MHKAFFEINEETDLNLILSIPMGVINNIQIIIDNVKLEGVAVVELSIDDLLGYMSEAKEIISSDKFNGCY